MNRLRLATWAALTGLGLLAGCRSFNPCDPCEQQQGFFSRLCGRRNGSMCSGPVIGTPVSAMSVGGDCCDGGPVLGDPPFGGIGPVMPSNGFHGGLALPPVSTFPEMGPPPAPLAQPYGAPYSAPPLSMPPMNMLPAPTTTAPPPLAPVPNGNGLATPTPAGPSAMSRIR